MNPFAIFSQAVRTDGNVSVMRIIVLYGCFVSLTIPAVLWVTAMMLPQVIPLCVPASGVFGGTLTALLGLKLVQNGQENSAPKE